VSETGKELLEKQRVRIRREADAARRLVWNLSPRIVMNRYTTAQQGMVRSDGKKTKSFLLEEMGQWDVGRKKWVKRKKRRYRTVGSGLKKRVGRGERISLGGVRFHHPPK